MTHTRKNVVQFSVAHFLQLSALLTALVNYPHFLTNVCGYSNRYAGTLVGIIAVANLAAVFPLGLLSDRISPKKIYVGSQICTICCFLMLPFCRSRFLLALLFITAGIGFLGFAAGGMTGGYVQDLARMISVPALPFYTAAGLTVILLAWTLFLPDTKPEKIKFGEYIRDIWDIKVIVIISIFILIGLHYGVEQYGFPKLVQEGLGLSSRQMGNLYLCIGVVLGGMAFLLREFFETRKKHFYYFGIALSVIRGQIYLKYPVNPVILSIIFYLVFF